MRRESTKEPQLVYMYPTRQRDGGSSDVSERGRDLFPRTLDRRRLFIVGAETRRSANSSMISPIFKAISHRCAVRSTLQSEKLLVPIAPHLWTDRNPLSKATLRLSAVDKHIFGFTETKRAKKKILDGRAIKMDGEGQKKAALARRKGPRLRRTCGRFPPTFAVVPSPIKARQTACVHQS